MERQDIVEAVQSALASIDASHANITINVNIIEQPTKLGVMKFSDAAKSLNISIDSLRELVDNGDIPEWIPTEEPEKARQRRKNLKEGKRSNKRRMRFIDVEAFSAKRKTNYFTTSY